MHYDLRSYHAHFFGGHVTTVRILGGLKKMFDISRSKKDGAKLDHTF